MESKKKILSDRDRIEWWVPGAGGYGTWGDVGQWVETSSYETKTFQGGTVQHGDGRSQRCLMDCKVPEEASLQRS